MTQIVEKMVTYLEWSSSSSEDRVSSKIHNVIIESSGLHL